MYRENRYLLSWVKELSVFWAEYPRIIEFFIIGSISGVFFLFAALILTQVYSGKRKDSSGNTAWVGVSLAVIVIALGFCIPLIPLKPVVAAGSKLQFLGFIVFETAAFCAVYLSYQKKINREGLYLLLAGTTLWILLGFLSVSAAAAGWSLLLVLGCLFFFLKARRVKHQYAGYVLLAGVLFGVGGAFFLPVIPQLLLWGGGIVVFLVIGAWFSGFFSFNEVNTILPAREHVTQAVSPFIPKEFLSILNKDTVMDLQLGDHIKQEMTIFFSDIRQFTDLSENLSPEDSFKFINSYLARIVPVIAENGGFVDKYVGDAIMALFPREKGADMAVRTAIAIQKKLVEYNSHRLKCGYRPLSMGIGLHTGTLMLGVVGVEDRMQNTVISDAVNLASRLESITKVFNISMAISEETFKKLEDPGSYMYRFIGKVRVKGKLEPVSVFEIFDGVNPDMMERKMKANMFFEQGMLNYYQKNFSEALLNFQKVMEILPDDGASIFYLQNCLAKIK
jgi:two-component system sensor histidine kinase ChiS